MKRAVIILLATVFMLTNIFSVMAADTGNQSGALPQAVYDDPDAKEWTMGRKKNINGQAQGVQGSNGWYCLYTTETNKNGSFNVQLMSPATWGKTTNAWKYYGVSYNWSPEGAYAMSGYEFVAGGDWWRMDGNGRLDPTVTNGLLSGAYAWKASKSGTYEVTVGYVAGGSNEVYNGIRYFATDGVTLSINTKDEILNRFNAPATTKRNIKLSEGTMSGTASLKKGELVYIIVDPQKSGAYAHAELTIDITLVEEKEEEEEKEPSEEGGNGPGDSGGSSGEGTSGEEVSDGGSSIEENSGDEPADEEELDEEKPDDTKSEENSEKKNPGNENESSSGGDSNGNGGLSGEDKNHSSNDPTAPSTPDNTDEEDSTVEETEDRTAEEAEEETEDSTQYPVLVLSKEAGEKLTLALSKKEAEDASEAMEEEIETEDPIEVMQGKMANYSGQTVVVNEDQDSMRVLLIIIIETLIFGAVFGVAKYYLST